MGLCNFHSTKEKEENTEEDKEIEVCVFHDVYNDCKLINKKKKKKEQNFQLLTPNLPKKNKKNQKNQGVWRILLEPDACTLPTWGRGLVADNWLWDQEVPGSSPGCVRSTLSPWDKLFTCISSPHSCVKRAPDYQKYPRVTCHL